MTLHIAANGWQHDHWLGHYYPEDLPPEWRFDFYGNEFRAVLLPQEMWSKASVEEFQQWLEESSDDFLFFIEYSPMGAGDGDALNRLFNVLRPRLGGLYLTYEEIPEPGVLNEQLQALGTDIPICIGVKQGVLSAEIPPGLTVCVSQDGETVCHGGNLAVVSLHAVEDQRQLDYAVVRREIEKLSAYAEQGSALLVCDNIAILQSAKVIAELLAIG